jgi:hypothetical protein
MHPYKSLDSKHFWAPAVAQRNMLEITDLWQPKFRIGRRAAVATYGSCFAQHIGRALAQRGFNWLITEPGPVGLSEANAKKFNYGVFSARTGNIYTASLLKQWLGWATKKARVPDEVWEQEGRFYDPFRPNIEPDGFESRDEMVASREMAINAFRRSVTDSDVFVFTLGLTESWFHRTRGYEYPMCPGTIAGQFDAQVHEFRNQDYLFIHATLVEAIHEMRQLNPDLLVLLTVSPVPLTATMSGNHVLVATMESKSILRAVAGAIRNQFEFVDYFPSYEIINSPCYRGIFFDQNMRTVSKAGVDHVMSMFFGCLQKAFGETDQPNVEEVPGPAAARRRPGRRRSANEDDADAVICEEEMLGLFAR